MNIKFEQKDEQTQTPGSNFIQKATTSQVGQSR